MAHGLTRSDLGAEWQSLPKNWYSIYQWKRTSRAGYLEWVAEWIVQSFSQITLLENDLRTHAFRVADHRGQIELKTGIEQLTEKRIVRAMFNSKFLPLIGDVIDYEVPLKDTAKAAHGDIDLLCSSKGTSLCLEVKKPLASESVLKAVLQAYAYTSLVSTKKQKFLTDFSLDPQRQLTPAVLTFASAKSGRQLKEIRKYPQLLILIRMLNSRLENDGIAPLRFFVIQNADAELRRCLTTITEANGDVKAVFREDFALSIVEQMLP